MDLLVLVGFGFGLVGGNCYNINMVKNLPQNVRDTIMTKKVVGKSSYLVAKDLGVSIRTVQWVYNKFLVTGETKRQNGQGHRPTINTATSRLGPN